MEVIHVNAEDKIIYHSSGAVVCKTDEEFNKLILQEKTKIEARDYILNRFEHWEVDSVMKLRGLLISRSRNNSEKNLVHQYIGHINRKEN